MSELITSHHEKRTRILEKEISLLWAVVIFLGVMLGGSAVLYAIGQHFFWKTPQALTLQERGLAYYQALVEKEPQNPDYIVDLGWYHYQAGNYELALDSYLQAISINPSHFGALYNTGLTYLQLSDTENGVLYLRKAVEQDPGYWEAQMALGVAYMNRQEWQPAEASLSEALLINWHSSDTHFYMGVLLEKTGRYPESAEHYQEALNYSPQFVLAREGLQRVTELHKDVE